MKLSVYSGKKSAASSSLSSWSTRSILLIARTTCLMPSNDAIKHDAVFDQAPFTGIHYNNSYMGCRSTSGHVPGMLFVSWVSATMKLRLSVEKYRYATSIVMPCSRSAIIRRQEERSRLASLVPYLRLSASSAASWSSNITLASLAACLITLIYHHRQTAGNKTWEVFLARSR